MWNESFAIDLESSSTLRLICYKRTNSGDEMLGKSSLKVCRNYLWRQTLKSKEINVLLLAGYLDSTCIWSLMAASDSSIDSQNATVNQAWSCWLSKLNSSENLVVAVKHVSKIYSLETCIIATLRGSMCYYYINDWCLCCSERCWATSK